MPFVRRQKGICLHSLGRGLKKNHKTPVALVINVYEKANVLGVKGSWYKEKKIYIIDQGQGCDPVVEYLSCVMHWVEL